MVKGDLLKNSQNLPGMIQQAEELVGYSTISLGIPRNLNPYNEGAIFCCLGLPIPLPWESKYVASGIRSCISQDPNGFQLVSTSG